MERENAFIKKAGCPIGCFIEIDHRHVAAVCDPQWEPSGTPEQIALSEYRVHPPYRLSRTWLPGMPAYKSPLRECGFAKGVEV
jgi:hypothetical protein